MNIYVRKFDIHNLREAELGAVLKEVCCVHLAFATRSLSGVFDPKSLVQVMSKSVNICSQPK